VSLVASTLGVARSTVYERVTGNVTSRGRYTKADDAQLLPLIQQIAAPPVGLRPPYAASSANDAPIMSVTALDEGGPFWTPIGGPFWTPIDRQ
jgi:hypothetical protein